MEIAESSAELNGDEQLLLAADILRHESEEISSWGQGTGESMEVSHHVNLHTELNGDQQSSLAADILRHESEGISSCGLGTGESTEVSYPVNLHTDQQDEQIESVLIEMPRTNKFVDKVPHLYKSDLNTTKENNSLFLAYSIINNCYVGCEFTLRRKGKFPRYECKKCRKLCDRNKTSGKPAAITLVENRIKEIKTTLHHPDCQVEYSGTAIARSAKNAAVVFKSKYGGTSKHVYDTHTKILRVSLQHEKVTATDIADGFKTFEYAGSALKKSGKRKSATKSEKLVVDEKGTIDKMSTSILKSTLVESEDFFLIGQDEVAGVIVLGSRLLIEKFFQAKKAMSDGTFKMSPKGYKQSYMLWFIADGMYNDEYRSKAMLSVTFILKGKSQEQYKIAFTILEEYRKSQNIPAPSFEEYLTDDGPAVRNVVKEFYADTSFSLCFLKLKKILVLPLLSEGDIIPAFKSLSSVIMTFIQGNFNSFAYILSLM